MRAFLVDAFVRAGAPPPTGNCAGVVLLEEGGLGARAALAVAGELRQTETAFVDASASPAGARNLTWYTPTTEVPLCGHATLAAAAALVDARGEAGPFRFATPSSGELIVHHDGDLFELDLPAAPPGGEAPAAAAAVARAVVGGDDSAAASVSYNAALQYLVIVLKEKGKGGRAALRALAPDMATLLAAAPAGDVSGVIATTLDGITILSRFWGPWMGIDEVGKSGGREGRRDGKEGAHSSFSRLFRTPSQALPTPCWARCGRSSWRRARNATRRGWPLSNCPSGVESSRCASSATACWWADGAR